MRRFVAITACLILTSCAAGMLAEGGAASLAAEGALVEGAIVGSRLGAMGAASRLMVAPEAATAARGAFGSAMEGLASGQRVLLVDASGVIRAGSRGVASLQGETLFIENRAAATLRNGYLYTMDGGPAVGRLRGAIPARDVWLEFMDGTSAPNLRPMLVDVLRLENGRYLVRLANGTEAWLPVAALGLAVLGTHETGECDPNRGAGVLVRPSGEPVSFSSCERQEDVLVLQTDDGAVAVAPDQAQEIIYGPSGIRFAQSIVGERAES